MQSRADEVAVQCQTSFSNLIQIRTVPVQREVTDGTGGIEQDPVRARQAAGKRHAVHAGIRDRRMYLFCMEVGPCIGCAYSDEIITWSDVVVVLEITQDPWGCSSKS